MEEKKRIEDNELNAEGGAGAPVHMAAVLEYLAAEILESSKDCPEAKAEAAGVIPVIFASAQ